MVKPTQLFKYLSLILLLLGVYEGINILNSTSEFYTPDNHFFRSLWSALRSSYNHSPHTFIIAGVCLILSFQTLSYWSLSQVSKMQHEELLKHLLEILRKKNSFESED
jgi:hypothetical protein